MLLVPALASLGLACATEKSDAAKTDDIAPSENATAPSTETTTTSTSVADGPEPTCEYTGSDPDFGYMNIELTFTNTLGEVDDLELTYALLDGEGGTRFLTQTAGITLPSANEQFRIDAGNSEELPPNIEESTIDCKVLAVEELRTSARYERATDADTCTVLGVDSDGRPQVEVSVTNPFDETTSLQAWWAMQGPGLVRFDRGVEAMDLVGAGETIKLTGEGSYGAVPGWVGEGEVTCTVLGVRDLDF